MFKKATMIVSSIALALSVASCSTESTTQNTSESTTQSTTQSTSERTNFPDKIVEAGLHHTDMRTSDMAYMGMMFCLGMYEGESYTELRDELIDYADYYSATTKQADALLEISHEFYCPEIEKS